MARKSFFIRLGSGKKGRAVFRFCLLVLAALVLAGAAVWYIPGGGITTVGAVLDIPAEQIDRIDASNGDNPQLKITDQNDIRQLLGAFTGIKIHRVSAMKNAVVSRLRRERAGNAGLYFVVYKNGSPYVHVEYLKPKTFNIHPHEMAERGEDIFYSTSGAVDTARVNAILTKYHINTI